MLQTQDAEKNDTSYLLNKFFCESCGFQDN